MLLFVDGAVGVGMFCDGSKGKLVAGRWHNVAVAVDCTKGTLRVFVDGRQTVLLSKEVGLQELLPDGLLALKTDEEQGGLCVFASGEDHTMLGGFCACIRIHTLTSH